ncbi:GntR family transcriptional regulator [Spirochaetia bacterium]|nr:GntR family transcriptional regulator [Spirochaetia bacterium]
MKTETGMGARREFTNKPREEATEFIESYIIKNKLAAHERLPSERKLCDSWGFNRTTLRNAIRKLEAEGILYSRHGSGTFVTPPKLLRNLQDMESLYAVAERAQKTLRTTQLYAKVRNCTQDIASELGLPPENQVFVLQRLRTMDGLPFMLETTYVDYTQCQGIEKYDFSGESFFHVLERDFNIQVDHGVENLTITYVGAEEAELLEIPVNQAVFLIKGVSDTSGGKHIEYFESVVRSDQVRFISTLVGEKYE